YRPSDGALAGDVDVAIAGDAGGGDDLAGQDVVAQVNRADLRSAGGIQGEDDAVRECAPGGRGVYGDSIGAGSGRGEGDDGCEEEKGQEDEKRRPLPLPAAATLPAIAGRARLEAGGSDGGGRPLPRCRASLSATERDCWTRGVRDWRLLHYTLKR